MIPQLLSVRHFVQFGNAYAVLVGRHLLGYDVHCHFAQIHVGTDAGCCSNAGLLQHIPNHRYCQLVSCFLVSSQIVGNVHKDLVYAIDMNILRRDVLQIDTVDFAAYLDVLRHTGHSDNEVHVCLACFLIHLEQSSTPGDAVCLQRRRDSQTDGFLGSALIGHNQSCGKRIKSSLHTFNAGIERLEVDSNILPRPRCLF